MYVFLYNYVFIVHIYGHMSEIKNIIFYACVRLGARVRVSDSHTLSLSMVEGGGVLE